MDTKAIGCEISVDSFLERSTCIEDTANSPSGCHVDQHVTCEGARQSREGEEEKRMCRQRFIFINQSNFLMLQLGRTCRWQRRLQPLLDPLIMSSWLKVLSFPFYDFYLFCFVIVLIKFHKKYIDLWSLTPPAVLVPRMAHSFIEYAVRLSIAFSEVSNMICLSFFSSSTDCLKTSSLRCHFLHLAPVVQKMDSAVHWINLGNQLRRDLSRG